MAKVYRTVNPLHFEDLEPHRFEDLIRQLAYGFRQWRKLEATGRLGKDEGVDIRGVEAFIIDGNVEAIDDEDGIQPAFVEEEREWRIQCKRYNEIGPKLMKSIIAEVVPHPEGSPYGIIIAAACDVSAKTIADFHAERERLGIAEGYLWTKAHLEDMLFRPENDHLLFAYFGFSLVAKRRSRLQDVRGEVSIKRKLARICEAKKPNQNIFETVLIRDIDDNYYPFESEIPGFIEKLASDWHPVTLESFDVHGMIVSLFNYRGWMRDDGTWDVTKQLRERSGQHLDEWSRRRAEKTWQLDRNRFDAEQEYYNQIPETERFNIVMKVLLPFSSIIEVDPFGDSRYCCPHLYCRFSDATAGPYNPSYHWFSIYKSQFQTIYLKNKLRSDLFDDLPNKLVVMEAQEEDVEDE